MTERRFIEEHFPVRKVSEESSREKSIRHGHISTLHMWWARRPLAASRATIYASLIPAPKEEEEITQLNHKIAELSRWENPINSGMIKTAREHIMKHHKTPPKVLDPFAGGGAIPLEALRLGCETYATDYNPVANLIVKAATVYPFINVSSQNGIKSSMNSQLIDDVTKWSQWIMEEARKDLAAFFPDKDGEELIGYMWSRCIPCQNPRCKAIVPLIKQFWLSNTDKKKIVLMPLVDGKTIKFEIKEINEKNKEFNPATGTVNRGKATCLICGHRMNGDVVKSLFAREKNTEKINIIVTRNREKPVKNYKIPNQDDITVFKNAQKKLQKKYGMKPILEENLPPHGTLGFGVQRYGMKTWGDLFNDRQKLVMLTFVEKILEAIKKIQDENPDTVQSIPYLGILLDRLADKNSTLCRWNAVGTKIEGVFGRQALPMIWDYVEVNPFTSVGWPNMEQWVVKVLKHLTNMNVTKPVTVQLASATEMPFPDEFFDAVITDPPYYDNVPYSHLSDFFYVWLKRTIGRQFPDLFSTPLTPKTSEIVAYSNGQGGREEGKLFFENMMKKAFREVYRVLKPEGISIVVYAHKSTEGWETLINSLLKSGLVITAAWPIHTEMKGRLRSKKSAALFSSIYMVCRKLDRKPVGFYRDMRRELERYLDKKLDQLWKEGISGADFFIASIGSAIEVYGKYDRVIDDKDQDVPVPRLLEDTRTIVTNYAIDKVTRGEFSDKISKMTRFYILWRWAHGESKVPFDDAKKLAQSVGIDLAEEWNSGFIRKEKEYIRVVGPDERKSEDLEDSDELIDVLHCALLMWRNQRIGEAHAFLEAKGYGHSEMLRRVAQAISESLSDSGSSEKGWIDGMFTGDMLTSRASIQKKII